MLQKTLFSTLAGIAVGMLCWILTHSLWCIAPALVVLVAVFFLLDHIKTPVQGLDALSLQVGNDPDEILTSLREQAQKINACMGTLPHADVDTRLCSIETTLQSMYEYLQANREDAHKLRKLVKYYLPTLLSLLLFCKEYGQGDEEWMSKFRENLRQTDTALQSMAKQLYQHQKVTTQADMDVMVQMMQRDGHLQAFGSPQAKKEDPSHE